MNDYEKKADENLQELKKQKEDSDRNILNIEILIGTISIALFLALIAITSLAEMQESTRILIIALSTVFVFLICLILLKIEQVVGYYECKKCHHKYVPTYKSVLWSAHIGRKRYVRCPKCNQKSWHKKVVIKE